MKKHWVFIFIIGLFLTLSATVYSTPAPQVTTWIAAGWLHTAALKQDGTVWTWGSNSSGQLGDGTATERHSPVQVSGLTGVTAIAAGGYHTVALKQDGTVWTWGSNSNGQLGDGTSANRNVPVQVSGLTGVTAIAAGGYHTVALKQDGTVWTWGSNSSGQLGDGTATERYTPVQVSGLTGVTAIAAGGYHTVALKQDGTVRACGANSTGQLGDGTIVDRNTAVQVIGLTGVTAIAAGTFHTLALKQDGTVRAWGSNSNGQLGDGTTTNRQVPVQVIGLSTNVSAIAAGYAYTVARKLDGTVWAWGLNNYGQLGDGSYVDSQTPIQVGFISDVTAIAAGQYQTAAVRQGGTAWGWGFNANGQIGDGTTTDRYYPVESGSINLFLCTYSFSPSNYGHSNQGGNSSITVNSSADTCTWTASSSDSWISVTSGASGTGDGTVVYSVLPNDTGSARTGKIRIGNQDFFILQAKGTFADDPGDVFTPFIYAIYTKGITTGCGNDNYCPNTPVTRGMMAAFIIRAKYGEDFAYTTTPYFSDVPATHVFFKYVQKMKDTGITNVTGTYMVDDVVTRGQMAAFIMRAKFGEIFAYTTTPYFSDVPNTHIFFKYVQKMRDTGITSVTGTYMVDDGVTRGQMAAFLARAFLGMAVVTPNPYQGSFQGIWTGACSVYSVNGWFSVTIDSSGNAYGIYDGDDSDYVAGLTDVTGSFAASGIAGQYSWQGTISLVNGLLQGNGTWNGKWGSLTCSGTWAGPVTSSAD